MDKKQRIIELTELLDKAARAYEQEDREIMSNFEYDALYDEYIMTRLRTSDGIPLDELSEKDRKYCLEMAKPHLLRDLLRIEKGHLCLTKEGIFTSNDIISDLMKIDN